YIRFYQSLAQAQAAALATSPGPDHFDPSNRYIQDADGFTTATNFYVFDDGDNVAPETMSIQAAIDAAVDGDTILVGPGTFQENVNVNKQLSIEGDGSSPAGTVITATTGNVLIVGDDNFDLRHVRIEGSPSTNGVFI